MAHPCCCPSVLGHRGCSMALGPWGSPRCRCREKAQVPVKPSSWLLAPPPHHSVSLQPSCLCRPQTWWALVPGPCLSVSALSAGAVLVGVSSGGAPWEPCSWHFGGQAESCFFLGQSDPAALNKTDPSRTRAFILFCFKVLVAQLCLTLCDPMDYNPPGSSVHGILQFRILEWVSMPSSGGSS